MATAVGGARDALARALRELASVALDEDEIEYVLDGAIDVDGTCAPREEFVEFVWPVIAPWVDDDEARARTLAGDARDGVDAAGTTTVEETRRVDRAPVCLGEGWREGVERVLDRSCCVVFERHHRTQAPEKGPNSELRTKIGTVQGIFLGTYWYRLVVCSYKILGTVVRWCGSFQIFS